MRHRSVFFLLALLGIFGPGRAGQAQDSPPAGGPASPPSPPPLDQAAVARTETATFALG